MAKEQWYIDNFYEEMYNISKSAYRGGDLTSYHPDKTNIILKRADSLKNVYLKMSPEEKAKRWQYVQGENNPMFGRRHTETTKLKISNHNRLYYSTHDNPFKGKKHSEESKAKLSEYASQRVGEKIRSMEKHTVMNLRLICLKSLKAESRKIQDQLS